MKICGFIYLFFFFFGGGGSLRNRIFFFWGGGVGGRVSFLYIIGRFKVKIQNGNIFWAANFQIFLGIPDIPDFFLIFFFLGGWGVGVNRRCWVQAYV